MYEKCIRNNEMSINKANNATAKEQCLNKTSKRDIKICWTHFSVRDKFLQSKFV